jgi:pimeloyl-ACP methyl ester carboxylesterase
MDDAVQTRIVAVDDIEVCVTIAGVGPPLLLQGWANCHKGPLFDAFARRFRVYAPEARNYGRTSVGRGPSTYGRMASDWNLVLGALGLEAAHVYGHSDGGCVALHMLWDYPHRVLSATISGTPYNRADYNQDETRGTTEAQIAQVMVEVAAGGSRLEEFLQAEGMPRERIRTWAEGLQRAWAAEPSFTPAMVALIDRPVLVILAGSDEAVPRESFVKLAEGIPGATTLDLPGLTHDLTPYVEEIAGATRALADRVGAR